MNSKSPTSPPSHRLAQGATQTHSPNLLLTFTGGGGESGGVGDDARVVSAWGGKEILNERLGGNPAASVCCYITLSCQRSKMSKCSSGL